MPNKIQNIARRKLRMINNTQNINDLRKPSPDELEMLYGNLAEYNSIRINEQWRVIFKWINSEAFDVEIVENI
ncbi:MAG: type II toxin-antitoxin system RelE/ParE family toxin [Candidatus Cyclobacteriaceae bacterium M2_1C_046]